MFKSLFKNQLGQVRYAGWEWAIMRAAYAVVLWFCTWHTLDPRGWKIRDAYDMDRANGLPSLLDLSFLGQPVFEVGLVVVMLVCLVFYVKGRCLLVVTGILSLVHMLVGGIFASPAGDHHATQIAGLIVIGQFGWFVWEKLRPKRFAENGLDSASGAIFWSQQMIVAGYVVSAISKWVNSGGGLIPGARWIAQVPNIAVQFEKNRLQAYYDKLEVHASDAVNQRTIDLVIDKPVIAMAFFGYGFYIELLAFLALFNRTAAALIGLGLIGLHTGIFFIMHLPFPYFISVDAIFLVNVPFWVMALLAVKKSRPGSLSSDSAGSAV